MNKSDLEVLERAFCREISGCLFQTKSKQAKRLAEEGFLRHVKFQDGQGWLRMTVEHYELTHLGRLTYCLTCKEPKERGGVEGHAKG